MCFYIPKKRFLSWLTNRNHYQSAKIASTDIPCFKVLSLVSYPDEPYYESPVQGEKYFDKNCGVDTVEKTDNCELLNRFGAIYEGLHTYSTYDRAESRRWSIEFIFNCVIPKGTRYYYNKIDQEYVSEKIIVSTQPIEIK